MAKPTEAAVITRLPDYFPTYPQQCTVPAQEFFGCFDRNSKMTHPGDRDTPKSALQFCQPEIKAYMTCVEAHHTRSGKPWWKVW